MLEILQQDYIRTARAKGCKEKTVNKHALKNSLFPTVTVIGFNLASLLSGTVILESTFVLPGLGSMLVDATLKQDYWVINVCMVVIAFIYLFTVFIIDILYAVLDPRIRY
jgi:peptide/nickel transport system permease protein